MPDSSAATSRFREWAVVALAAFAAVTSAYRFALGLDARVVANEQGRAELHATLQRMDDRLREFERLCAALNARVDDGHK
jgi:hypothetical protein